MRRRQFLASVSAAFLVPTLARAQDPAWIEYQPGTLQGLLNEGRTVFVDYHATWCSTCKAQRRTVQKLRARDPAYDAAMAFVSVDWDIYSRHPVTTSRAIPRRSTLLVLRGTEELGRLVAGTREADIKALLDIALAATG